MANPWFRMYAEFATDPKVQMMSEADQRRFVMLLCLRCSNDDVTLHDDEVAFQLRISNDEWSRWTTPPNFTRPAPRRVFCCLLPAHTLYVVLLGHTTYYRL